MAYRPNPMDRSNLRDKAYPSQIAEERPALMTRVHCHEDYDEYDPDNSIRGPKTDGEYSSSPCDRFNAQLREGHGGRNRGED